MASFLLELCQGGDSEEVEQLRHRADQLERCGAYLEFRHYFTEDVVRLHAAKFCQQDKLCPFCAIRRGAKLLRKYTERVVWLLSVRPELVPVLVTLTVRNGADLVERYRHLVKSHAALMRAGKDRRSSSRRSWSEASHAAGSVASVEVKRGEGTRGGLWHPHVHAVWLCDGDRLPSADSLSHEWHSITGDSHQVDVRPFHFVRDDLPATADNVAADFAEVFKYALKFSTMDLADNWHAFEQLRGRHMIFPRGILYGLELPADLADDELDLDDLPFVRLLFRYAGGRYS
jgi:hypothetical protein